MFSTSGRGHLRIIQDKPASSACFSHSHAQVKANTGRARSPHLIGTARFASIKGHLGVGKCDILHSGCLKHRCDDLESLGYMLSTSSGALADLGWDCRISICTLSLPLGMVQSLSFTVFGKRLF